MKRPLLVYVVLAFGLSWAAALPLWFGDGLGTPLKVQALGALMMFTPTIGVLGVWAVSRTPFRRFAKETGLTLGERRGRTGRLVLAAWLGVPLLTLLAMGISAAAGLVTLDLGGFSLLAEMLRARGVEPPADMTGVAVTQLVLASLLVPVQILIPALGEEWGWRGWLLPRLIAGNGVVMGLVYSGLIWGLWHAPLTLLGYNYPRLGSWAALAFIGFCTLAGVVIGWLRLRSGSVWPAVVAHASLNAVAGPVLLLGDAADPPNEIFAGITGVAGWVLLALLGAALLRFLPVGVPHPAVPATAISGETAPSDETAPSGEAGQEVTGSGSTRHPDGG
ncbi:CPBP family intramembrane glutamic endopeptidase [Nonomuraea sp. NPDC049309]|uniref:CPBP family intramembrane glutamic endopeptidase n=1 Tax=Nonomuraea sp. NPDC049309 TaxID=3364350 RepID=UPI00371B5BB0